MIDENESSENCDIEEAADQTDDRFDTSVLLPSKTNSVTPLPDRQTTNAALDALLHASARPSPCNVFGLGPLVLSDIPISIKNNKDRGVILGIDEAGRGPVLGPMTYAAAFWNPDAVISIPAGFHDSKQLTPEKRAALFKEIKSSDCIGFVLRVLHASEISRNMLRRVPYNLNAMSHDAAIQMIWAVLDAGVKIETCYVDTVGVAESYKKNLERVFEGHDIEFIVEKKADAKYAPCSAASVVAKEARDLLIANWKWTETSNYQPRDGSNYGSGYPSDPKAAKWLDNNCNVDPPFGFPDFVRFSWGPAKAAMQEDNDSTNSSRRKPKNSGLVIKWEADEEEDGDESGRKQSSLHSFMVAKKEENPKKRGHLAELKTNKRLGIFNELGLSKVTAFVESV
mmetsp:Transcript_22054/g.45314  ORF Transcript_22054/g.45314 Transcript_22054/m.45314 type:complete len:397 (-) Transcript_22054:278-1468(-)